MLEFMKQGTTVSEVYCKTFKKLCSAIQNKRHGMLTYGVVFFHDNVCPHTAASIQAFQLGVVWPPSLQPWYHSERLLPVYLPEELVKITVLQQLWLDVSCQNVVELTGGRLLWHRHTETYSPIQVPQFRWWLLRSSLSMYIYFLYIIFFSLFVLLTAHQRLFSR
jgi:hypothetical protein